jgi:hypothetical protein
MAKKVELVTQPDAEGDAGSTHLVRTLFNEAMCETLERRIAAELERYYPRQMPVTMAAIEALLKRPDEWEGDY